MTLKSVILLVLFHVLFTLPSCQRCSAFLHSPFCFFHQLTISLPLGLYFKLHGTHRPTSMKKTVIKRRKRVPAATGTGPPIPMRMSDQAAAEALVSVGRAGAGSAEESDEVDTLEGEQPKKKRVRKSKGQDEGGSQSQWAGEGGPSSPQHHHLHLHPQYQQPHRPQSIPAIGFMHPSLQRPGGPSFSGVLPGINSMDIAVPGGPGVPGTSGGPSYPPAGSSSPGRTHSPQSGASQPPPGTMIMHTPHGHAPPIGMFQPLDVPGSGTGPGLGGMVSILGIIPSVSDLERHYAELEEQKKRMEEMLDRTDKMMQGLKRGISEMQRNSTSTSGPASRPPSTAPGAQTATSSAPSVPLQRPSSNAAGEPERREPVWTVVDSTARGSE